MGRVAVHVTDREIAYENAAIVQQLGEVYPGVRITQVLATLRSRIAELKDQVRRQADHTLELHLRNHNLKRSLMDCAQLAADGQNADEIDHYLFLGRVEQTVAKAIVDAARPVL
jgi:regulator of replication initiation timing